MNEYIVYAHENKINGKVYIGITSKKNPEDRWKNGKGYDKEKQSLFRNAIDKYGWDNFNHIILFRNLSKEDACKMEQKLIFELKTQNREFGYNMTSGGETVSPNGILALQKSHEDKRRKVVRLNDGVVFDSVVDAEKNTGVKNPNIINACKGIRRYAGKMEDDSPMYWAYYYDGINIEEALFETLYKNSCRNREYKSARKVVCITTGKIFFTIVDAEKEYNCYGAFLENIIKCCKNKQNYCGTLPDGTPLRWMYYWDYISKEKNEIENIKNSPKPIGKMIKCIEDGKIFYSCSQAARFYGFKCGCLVSQQISGRIKNVNVPNTNIKLHFLYI